jgi:hypothetical protein
MARYRIVTDDYAGYEVQAWHWWRPFWSGLSVHGNFANTFLRIEDAENFAQNGDVVKYIDRKGK